MKAKAWMSIEGYSLVKAAICAFGAALCIASPEIIGGNDFGAFIIMGVLFLGLSLAVVVTLSVALFRREWRFATALLLVYFASLFLFSKIGYSIHNEARWVLVGSRYRENVLHQQVEAGEFQHVEWDGWGGLGAGDTTAYLVFDPRDSLRAELRDHDYGKFTGIPCGASQVHRFASHWYAVTLYTDTDWKNCA